jgi:hypothetical protein
MSRTRTPLTVLALALACALAGTLLTAGLASAASRGYKIYNLSSHPLRLVGAEPVLDPHYGAPPQPGHYYLMDFEGRPKDGDVLMPGAPPHDWELKYNFLQTFAAGLTYDIVNGSDPKDHYKATLKSDQTSNDSTCDIDRRLGVCTAEGLKLTVSDPAGTVHDIPSGRAQEQAETLRDLCSDSNAAACTFKAGTRTPIQTQTHLIGHPLANCREDEGEKKISLEDKVKLSSSVEISSKTEVDVFEPVKQSITAKYGHDWTTEHTFKKDVKIKVRPGHIGWLAGTAPVVRYRGDFTLTLGNTTWHLRDVYFDTPDPAGNGHWATDDRELTPDEYRAQCPHGPSDGLRRAPAYLVPMDWKGTGRADTLLAGRESHTVRGFAGNDLIRGGRGHDTLDGGRGNDILDGGPGRDTLDGGPGADTMIDNRGPTLVEIGPDTGPGTDTVDVRDGRGDDTVFCGSRSSTVIVDAGDSVIGRCGRVIRRGPAQPTRAES